MDPIHAGLLSFIVEYQLAYCVEVCGIEGHDNLPVRLADESTPLFTTGKLWLRMDSVSADVISEDCLKTGVKVEGGNLTSNVNSVGRSILSMLLELFPEGVPQGEIVTMLEGEDKNKVKSQLKRLTEQGKLTKGGDGSYRLSPALGIARHPPAAKLVLTAALSKEDKRKAKEEEKMKRQAKVKEDREAAKEKKMKALIQELNQLECMLKENVKEKEREIARKREELAEERKLVEESVASGAMTEEEAAEKLAGIEEQHREILKREDGATSSGRYSR